MIAKNIEDNNFNILFKKYIYLTREMLEVSFFENIFFSFYLIIHIKKYINFFLKLIESKYIYIYMNYNLKSFKQKSTSRCLKYANTNIHFTLPEDF